MKKAKEEGRDQFLSFKTVEEALKRDYELSETHLITLEKLLLIRQKGSVRDYNAAFEKALSNMQSTENLPKRCYMGLYSRAEGRCETDLLSQGTQKLFGSNKIGYQQISLNSYR